MQLIAMISMLIDHVGIAFFKGETMWRLIGRLAFPIYAYGVVIGYRYTRSLRKYMLRLLLIAVLSQVPFMAAFGVNGVNAVGTLLVCVLIVHAIDTRSPQVWVPLAAVSVVVMEWLDFDYGLYGLLLVLIYKYSEGHRMALNHLGLNALFLFLKGWVLELFSIIPTLVIAYAPRLHAQLERRRMPRWLWWSFYPAHLTVIACISRWMRTGAW